MNHLCSSIIIFCEKGEISVQNPVHFEMERKLGVKTNGTYGKVWRDHWLSWRLSSDITDENFIKLLKLENPWRSSYPNPSLWRQECWNQQKTVMKPVAPSKLTPVFEIRTVALTLYPTETFKSVTNLEVTPFLVKTIIKMSASLCSFLELEIPSQVHTVVGRIWFLPLYSWSLVFMVAVILSF